MIAGCLGWIGATTLGITPLGGIFLLIWAYVWVLFNLFYGTVVLVWVLLALSS